MKELKKSIARLERDQHRILRELRDMDKIDGRDERLARVEKLASLELIESDLKEKQLALTNSKLLPRKRDLLRVAIGSVVELIDMQGRLIRYTIVDSLEANPSDGRISAASPLGRTLIGKQIKDMIEWGVGSQQHRMQLIGIH